MELSETQYKAINHNTGPALVLAGPGSGKTTVIIHRINTLINKYNVNPSNILVITFTKAAVVQMKERFLRLSGNTGIAVAFGTFHAVYFTILKHSYNYSSDCIIKVEQQMTFIREIISKFELEIEDENEFIGNILSEISHVKNGRLNLEEFNSSVCPENTFRKVYRQYEKLLQDKRLIDFDDMLIDCFRLLSQQKDIREAWQNKYRYILIDEFQDINQTQFDVIELIARKYRNIFVVGDDDQSIYGFRGSKPEIMRNFEEVYKEAVHIELSENYRSAERIVTAAKSVIDRNIDRFSKNTTAVNASMGIVEVHEVCNLEEEIEFVIEKIKELHRLKVKYSDIAVLFRINSTGALLSGKMMMGEIPCIWQSQEKHIFDHWVAKDILAYIYVAKGNCTRVNMLRIINKPMRYITRSYLTEPVSLEKLKENYLTNEEMITRISDLQFDLTMIRKMTAFAAVNYIRRAVGYDEYIAEFARKHRVNPQALTDVAKEITEQAKGYNKISEWLDYVEKFKEEERQTETSKDDDKNGVFLQTMHSSKGLEFKAVFVIDFNEGMIPYHKAVLEEDIEEERRMFYVAMTRAKEYLYMVFTKERYNKKMAASRFFEELDKQSYDVYLLDDNEK